MPRYSVEEVLGIIQAFTPEEKQQLKTQLPSVIDMNTVATTPQQSQILGNITMGSGNAFAAQQVADGNIDSTQNNIQAPVKNANLQEALEILQKLKQDVNRSDALNRLEKNNIEGNIKFVEEEITKPQPDKNLFNQAIEGLKKGLEIISLVKPVMKVADLVSQIWGV